MQARFAGTYERTCTIKGRTVSFDILGIPGNARQRRKVVRQWRAAGYCVSFYIWKPS